MFKAIKEFFFGKPVATPVANTAPYKVPEPAAVTPIPLVVEAPAPVVVEVMPPPTIVTEVPTSVTVHNKGSKDPRDTNHDGVTSEEEKRAFALADLRDTNHDGVIDAVEKSTAKKIRKQSVPKLTVVKAEKEPKPTKPKAPAKKKT